MSARKVRLVVDQIRGRSVNDAYAILQFSKKAAAEPAPAARGEFVSDFEVERYLAHQGRKFVRRFDASGTSLGKQFRVSMNGDEDQFYSDVALAEDGSYVVVWSARNQDAGSDGIFARRFHADGTPITAQQFVVNTKLTHEQRAPSVAMDGSGDYVIAWESERQDVPDKDDQYGIYAQRYRADGTPHGGEFLVNTTVDKNQMDPSVAMGDQVRSQVDSALYKAAKKLAAEERAKVVEHLMAPIALVLAGLLAAAALMWAISKAPHRHHDAHDHHSNLPVAERRRRGGANMIAADAAGLRRLYAHLKAGGGAGVLPDQAPSKGQGRFAPFFGNPALTGVLVPRLVQRTGCRVLAGVCRLVGAGAPGRLERVKHDIGNRFTVVLTGVDSAFNNILKLTDITRPTVIAHPVLNRHGK